MRQPPLNFGEDMTQSSHSTETRKNILKQFYKKIRRLKDTIAEDAYTKIR